MDGVLRYQNILFVPNIDGLRSNILAEAHRSRYFIHPGVTKIYHDLKEVYWWEGMKIDLSKFVEDCPKCHQVKAEHLKPGGLTLTIGIQTWKFVAKNMDFVVDLTKTRKLHDSSWVIVDRMIKSAHFIPVKSIYKAEDYAKLYIDEIVRWHEIHLSIISDSGKNLLLIFGDLSKRSWLHR